jgi:pimeloyl-ACP methyl ester carboxylesterase
MRKTWGLFALGWALVIAGGLLAHLIQTSGGVRVEDVRFTGVGGTPMSALLYIPKTATHATPAPGILAVHGYINSREMQDGFAIEYARRGYVVLAIDQTGHGYSGASAFANGFGGPDGLKYLKALDFVDPANIGLEGHSMGGGAILAAAAADPNGYKSMVLEGSAPGTLFSPPGTTVFPRNLGVVYSRYDEFAPLMWGVPRAQDAGAGKKMLTVFGASSPVAPGQTYGSIAAGTGRQLYTPATTHPGDHFSPEAIGDSIDWFGKTLVGARPLPASDQIWIWKEIGNLIAFVGFVAVLAGAFQILLGLPYFAQLAHEPQLAVERRGARWWTGFLLTMLIPPITIYPFFLLGSLALPPGLVFPQGITNQLMVWALLNGVITLLVGLVLRGGKSATPVRWTPSILIALLTVGAGYLALMVCDFLFKADFRFWVVALKLMDARQFRDFLIYLVPFTAFFVVALGALHNSLAVRGDSAAKQYAWNVAALAGGFLLFLIANYAPLFIADHLLIPAEALNAIISIQFLPVLAVVALISTYMWRRTGDALPGALVCGLFVTWYIVAGTATQFRG